MKEEKKKKINLKEIFSDRKKKAIFELSCYGVFFLILILFIRISNFVSRGNQSNTNEILFTENIDDNYAYDVVLNVDNNSYHYYGKKLGHNGIVFFEKENSILKYHIINEKYYIMEDGNYILVDVNDIFSYIDYKYLDLNNIKEYLNNIIKEGDNYKIIISDLNELYADVKLDNDNNTIEIDYSNIFEDYNSVILKITYSNIDQVISLEE